MLVGNCDFPRATCITVAVVMSLAVANTLYLHTDREVPNVYRIRRSFDNEQFKNSFRLIHGAKASAFGTENSTTVYAQIGGTATLPCIVKKFNNGVVSWLRQGKGEPAILTVGPTPYSSDGRFFVEHVRHLQNWGLLIKHVQHSDAGLYECQVSTHPPTSILIQLKVTEAVAEIVGSPDLHLRAGSTIRLVCVLRDSTETPLYVFWYHDNRMINYDSGVTVLPDRSSSVLLLYEADQRNSGNYTCSPANAVPAFINVHVLNATEEEHPAAMLHANRGSASNLVISTFFMVLCVKVFILGAVER